MKALTTLSAVFTVASGCEIPPEKDAHIPITTALERGTGALSFTDAFTASEFIGAYILFVATLFPLSWVVSRVLLSTPRRQPELFDFAFAEGGFRALVTTSNVLADHPEDALRSRQFASLYYRALTHPVHHAIQECRRELGSDDIGKLSRQRRLRGARAAFLQEHKAYRMCCPIWWLPSGVVAAVALAGLVAVARRYFVVGLDADSARNLGFVVMLSLLFIWVAVISAREPKYLAESRSRWPRIGCAMPGEAIDRSLAALLCAVHGSRTVWSFYPAAAQRYGIPDPSSD